MHQVVMEVVAHAPKADDVEDLLCEVETVSKPEIRSTVHCLLATFLQKKQQKELPAKGNPPDLQEMVDQSKGVEWESLSNEQAFKVRNGAEAAKFNAKHPDRFIGSRFVVTKKQDEDGERVKSRWCLQIIPTVTLLISLLPVCVIVLHLVNFLEAGPLPDRYRPLFAKQAVGGIPGLDPEDVIEV